MIRTKIRRILADSLSTPLDSGDLDELAFRIAMMEEQIAVLRELPLEGVEPYFPPRVEDAP